MGPIDQEKEGRREAFWPLVIFAVAVVLRLLMLAGLKDAPTFQTPVLDAGHYNARAVQLLQGRTGPDLFWQPVLYPYFLAIVYRVVGHSFLLARVIQALVGGLTACLTFYAGRRMFGRNVGAAAGLIVAGWAPLMFYELDLVADGLSAIWSVLLLLQYLRVRESRDTAAAILLGLCAALSVLSRPTYLPFVLCGGAGLAWTGWKARSHRVPLLALSGFAALWLPASAFSLPLTGRFNPLPFSGGLNLHIGNNPDPCATLNIRPGRGWKELETEPERAGAVWPADRDAFFRRRVMEFARQQPAAFARGLLAKAWRFANSRELPRNEDPYLFRRYSRLLAAGMWKVDGWGFPFGILLPWVLVGAWFGRRETPRILPLFLVTYAASVVLVFVSSRYRLAWIPPAAILAARGGQAWCGQLRRRAWAPAFGTLALALAVAFLVSRPAVFCEETVSYEAEMRRLIGYAKWSQGRLGEAEELLRGALERDPSADTCDYLGRVLMDAGRAEEALAMQERAVQMAPGSAEILNNMGMMLGRQGRHREAIDIFRAALALQPDNPHIARNLELARQKAGQPAGGSK